MAANVFELNVNINSTIKSEAQKALNDSTNGSLPDVQLGDGTWADGSDYQDFIEKMEADTLKENKLKTAGKAAAIASTVSSGQQLVVGAMNWAHSRVSNIYKDEARANKISNIQSTVTETGGLVMSCVAGYAGGPVIGTINLALQLAGQALKVAQRVEAYQDKQKDYADESDYAMERLGLVAAGKGR